MEILRTPAEEFFELARYPYPARYVNVAPDAADYELLMHYVDVGKRDAPTVLMLHGEPTWSFLYRSLINMVTEAGYRVVAPDLIGFGKSDKPAAAEDYSYAAHLAWLGALVRDLELRRIILVCHDWGGLLGLRLLAAEPDRFARVVATNTFLPTGHEKLPDAFYAWRELARRVPELDVGTLIQNATTTHVPLAVLDAYRAPFPDETYKSGVNTFPLLVPTEPDDPEAKANAEAWKVLAELELPFLTAFSDSDPITAGADAIMRERIPGAARIEPVVIRGAHHFIQEDRGPELARAILDFLADHPLPRPAPKRPESEPEPAAEPVSDGGQEAVERAAGAGPDSGDAGEPGEA
jgi:haloalkane dehalogenase